MNGGIRRPHNRAFAFTDKATMSSVGTHMLVVTVPFVMYGLFHYLYLCYHKGEEGSPTKTILLDRPFLLIFPCWGIRCVIIIH